MGSVAFDVAPEVAFDYLVDARNRPEWQSSLRAVDVPDPTVRVGLRWHDLTWPGVRPAMELTVLERPTRWTEVGRWRGVTAELTLDFAPDGTGCRVTPTFEVRGTGLLRPVAALADRAAPRAVTGDLRRAARILSRAGTGQ